MQPRINTVANSKFDEVPAPGHSTGSMLRYHGYSPSVVLERHRDHRATTGLMNRRVSTRSVVSVCVINQLGIQTKHFLDIRDLTSVQTIVR